MPSSNQTSLGRRAPRLLATLMIVLGGSVLAGWLGRWPTLTHLIPGMTGMVAQTALDFILFGCAVLVPRRVEAGRSVVLLPSALILLLVAINLLQIASGLELGINLSGFHDWAADDNPRPGQQSMATSCSFLIAALSALALTALRKPAPRVVKVGRASVTLLFLIALAAIAGYALRIEWLVN